MTNKPNFLHSRSSAALRNGVRSLFSVLLVIPICHAETVGGLAGKVLRVTTLAAEGPGSLRAALDVAGPRLVVFEVGGVIDLRGRTLLVRRPHLTVAGQTAPDPGIT